MKKLLPIIVMSLFLFACNNKKPAASSHNMAEMKTDTNGMKSSDSMENMPGMDTGSYYTCSMDPQVKEDKPGKCPICKMELTAVKKSSNQNTDEIQLSEQQIQLGNIHTDTINSSMLGDKIVLTATLNIDQMKTTSISARVMG
ncbi:MAG: heavy metal-binding domain-containing protein, partial [Ferruginibacter sp.]